MFGIENSANNFGRSAGLLSNTDAQRPISAALGTLFIASDLLIIYRWNGTAWDTIGGGGGFFGGAINGLQQIGTFVALGGSLNQNTDINCFNYNFKFEVFNSFAIGNGTEPTLILNSSTETIITSFGGIDRGLKFDFANSEYIYGNLPTSTFLFIGPSNEIQTYSNGNGVGFNALTNQYVKVGDWAVSIAGLSTNYDFSTNRIENYSGDGYYNFANIPVYANNVAALAAGLIVGDIYRHSGGTGEQLHIVF